MEYQDFIKSKVVIADQFGFDTSDIVMSDKLFPHQADIVRFCLEGGRRAIFASFGLGKTFMQLEIGKQCIEKTGKHFLIVCPLGVSGEFRRDNKKLNTGLKIDYITNTEGLDELPPQFFITNYERVRMGSIDAALFGGVSFDEASILRNLKTQTTNFILDHFRQINYRFVATATPTPNDYIEILNYADYLGVISRGHALTRFFQRDSTKAGNLTLYEHRKEEFWQWVSTWAAFINTPEDYGYDGSAYVLPNLNIIDHVITYEDDRIHTDKYGTPILFKDISKSLLDVAREKRDGIEVRIQKAIEIVGNSKESWIIWHHLEKERDLLERFFTARSASVYGSLDPEEKEKLLIGFSENKYQYLLSKPKIAGSGCNFQNCHNMVFAGIDFKFNDFIQAIHRCYRFGQKKPVNVHLIYTRDEYEVMKVLREKWTQHLELNKHMIDLVRSYGLNSEIIKSQMQRQIFQGGQKLVYDQVTMYNNDCVIACDDIAPDSIGMILTSIPFGDHYEYSDNYNDFGHNHGNAKFFEQMDYLTPKLLQVLKPGHVAAIHVKDRIRYSYQNGTSFTTIADFSGQTVAHFEKHGFYLMGKITVTTDVVAENNQTYRLGWTEQCKDATKMGVGIPEYVLIFRKAPTVADNAYADEPVKKEKDDYTKALWQLDAHAYYRSCGDRLLTSDELRRFDLKRICAAWKKANETEIYSFLEHLRICEDLDELDKLSSTFMTLPVHSNNPMVWTDINRMNTLNADQVATRREKHICPLQFDIIERLINRYSMKGDIILDPFAGLFSTNYKAMELGRKSIGIELNKEYFRDGLFYMKALMHKLTVPTLFQLEAAS